MLEYTANADVAQGFEQARAERSQAFLMAFNWMFTRRRRVARVRQVSRWA